MTGYVMRHVQRALLSRSSTAVCTFLTWAYCLVFCAWLLFSQSSQIQNCQSKCYWDCKEKDQCKYWKGKTNYNNSQPLAQKFKKLCIRWSWRIPSGPIWHKSEALEPLWSWILQDKWQIFNRENNKVKTVFRPCFACAHGLSAVPHCCSRAESLWLCNS